MEDERNATTQEAKEPGAVEEALALLIEMMVSNDNEDPARKAKVREILARLRGEEQKHA